MADENNKPMQPGQKKKLPEVEKSIYEMYEDNVEAPLRKVGEAIGATMRVPTKKKK